MAVIALRNSGHIGRIGDWAERAARGRAGVDPFRQRGDGRAGGAVRRRGPAVLHQPVLRRRAAAGRRPADPGLRHLHRGGGQGAGGVQRRQAAAAGCADRPGRHAVDRPGDAVRADPPGESVRDSAQGEGALRAFGDHKGSGIAFMCEILAGLPDGRRRPPGRSPAASGGASPTACCRSTSTRRISAPRTSPQAAQDYARYVKASRPAVPGGEVLVPGEPEARTRARRLRDGIPLQVDTWAAIEETATRLGWRRRTVICGGAGSPVGWGVAGPLRAGHPAAADRAISAARTRACGRTASPGWPSCRRRRRRRCGFAAGSTCGATAAGGGVGRGATGPAGGVRQPGRPAAGGGRRGGGDPGAPPGHHGRGATARPPAPSPMPPARCGRRRRTRGSRSISAPVRCWPTCGRRGGADGAQVVPARRRLAELRRPRAARPEPDPLPRAAGRADGGRLRAPRAAPAGRAAPGGRVAARGRRGRAADGRRLAMGPGAARAGRHDAERSLADRGAARRAGGGPLVRPQLGPRACWRWWTRRWRRSPVWAGRTRRPACAGRSGWTTRTWRRCSCRPGCATRCGGAGGGAGGRERLSRCRRWTTARRWRRPTSRCGRRVAAAFGERALANAASREHGFDDPARAVRPASPICAACATGRRGAAAALGPGRGITAHTP